MSVIDQLARLRRDLDTVIRTAESKAWNEGYTKGHADAVSSNSVAIGFNSASRFGSDNQCKDRDRLTWIGEMAVYSRNHDSSIIDVTFFVNKEEYKVRTPDSQGFRAMVDAAMSADARADND